MKTRHHQSRSQFVNSVPSHGFWRVGLGLLAALLIFFLLPGLLAAQEAGEEVAPSEDAPSEVTSLEIASLEDAPSEVAPIEMAPLNEQAVAAAVAAAQPGLGGATAAPQVFSRELRTNRLWLSARHSGFADLLNRAARQALQHPDCNEVLYGSLNEFRTERVGTSFTILCLRDARTTFNQVFFADDLMSEEELNAVEEPASTGELERLRQMMQPQSAPDATASPGQLSPIVVPDDLPAPVVF